MERQKATTNLSLIVASAHQKLSPFVARNCRLCSVISSHFNFHLLPARFSATGLYCPVMSETAQRKGGGKPFRSILEPHFEFIRELRQRRKTWRQITELLLAEKNIRVTAFAPYLFYRRKLKRAAKSNWENAGNDSQFPPPPPYVKAPRPQHPPHPLRRPAPSKTPHPKKIKHTQKIH